MARSEIKANSKWSEKEILSAKEVGKKIPLPAHYKHVLRDGKLTHVTCAGSTTLPEGVYVSDRRIFSTCRAADCSTTFKLEYSLRLQEYRGGSYSWQETKRR